MDKIYIFDVDGTLTPSRRRMTEDFARFFDEWSKKNTFYLVSGSDLDKIKEQIPLAYLDRAEGVFTCGGNKFYIGSKLEYEKRFKPPETLLTYLGELIRFSETPVQSTNHREDRGAMLNFSVVGRDCTLEERLKYFEWDNEVGERKDIAEYIKRTWLDLDAVIGGQISIDIAPVGNDKSQVIKRVKNNNPNCKYIFVGDRTQEGGNDYPLAKVMLDMQDCEVYQAGEPSAEDGYKITQRILEEEMND
jgi:phosphomannomutase